ncbi:MAG: nitrilase [Phycisphaerae bacterium]|jgi:formamidase|nr:nitrilase [Phycisphaerae bacterium]
MTDRYHAAACQTSFPCPRKREEIADRVTRMVAMVEGTIVGYEPFFDVRLFAFPEFAHAAPVYTSVAELDRHLAVELPNEHTDRYVALARKYGIHIQTGSFIERRRDMPGRVFNSTALVGPSGVLSIYRKVNPWLPWEIHSSPHDIPDYPDELFPVVTTELGALGVATCYDWLFPEAIRQLAFNGCEVGIRISAYMDPWGATPPMDWWTLINRTRAVENTMYVVAANQGATLEGYPPFSWPGGSMAVDFDGRILAQADPGAGEKVVVAPIDLAALRAERIRRIGHDMRSHLRSEAYPYMQRAVLPRGVESPITDASIRARIESGRRNLS